MRHRRGVWVLALPVAFALGVWVGVLMSFWCWPRCGGESFTEVVPEEVGE